MPGYQQLSTGERVRVDAHIMDHFRDNQNGYTNEFRLLVREQARLSFDIRYGQSENPPAQIPEAMYREAYNTVLRNVRDVMSSNISRLPALQSNNVQLDRQLLNNSLRFLGSAMVDDLEANPVTINPEYNLTNFVNQQLASIQNQTGSNLRISGNTSDIPRGYLRRAVELQSSNLMTEYSPSVQAAVARLRTPLSDRLEAESIRVAVDELSSPRLTERVFGNDLDETREAVGRSLRARGVYLQNEDAVINSIVDAAVPIARGGKIDDPGGNRGNSR